MRVVLASESFSRKRAMDLVGVKYEVHPSSIDEKAIRDSDPAALTRKLAEAKAWKVAEEVRDGVIVSGDAVVAREGRIYEKPVDLAEAEKFLRELSGGEVEFVLLRRGKELFVTVGSDHTDRKAETISVSLSKQLCAKPIARDAWRYDEVKPHWEKLVLRSWIPENGKDVLYQEGPVSAMRSPEDLLSRFQKFSSGWAMFGGTFAAKGGIRPAPRFIMELEDPVLKRKLRHAYEIGALPVEG